MKKSLIFCFVTFFLAGTLKLPAQNPLIQNYTSFDGLPSNMVYQVYQDSRNYIWFITDAGVAKFDGSRFFYYSKQNGLNCNDVVRIKEDDLGRIWFFNMDATLNFYKDGVIFNNQNTSFLNSLTTNEFFRNFYEDSDHTLYFYYNHQREIYSLDTLNQTRKHKLTSFLVQNQFGDNFIEGMDIRYLFKASDGYFYIGSTIGLFKLLDFDQAPILVPGTPRLKEAFIDQKNNRFIVTGGIKYNEWYIHKIIDDFDIDSLFPAITINTGYISSIIEDNNGNVWVSTFNEGVYCYKGNEIILHFDIVEGQAIIQDHENNIWITSLKDGAYKISPYFNQYQHFNQSRFENKGIQALAHHKPAGVWMTNGSSVYLLQNEKMLKMDFSNYGGNINQLVELDDHTLVAGELNTNHYAISGIMVNDQSNKINFNSVLNSPKPLRKITSNSAGTGFISWNFFTVIQFKPGYFDDPELNELGERVYNAFYNSDGEIIVNTKENSILRNDSLIPDEKLAVFNKRIIYSHLVIEDSVDVFNLEGDSIFLIAGGQNYNLSASWNYPLVMHIKYLEYHSPALFIGTSTNIFYCDNPLDIVRGNPIELRMVDISFRNIHDMIFDRDRLYVASDDGLSVIPTISLNKASTIPPIPYFESIQINEMPVINKQQEVVLTGSNRIMIDFSSINYSFLPAIYSYKLEGLDSDWKTGIDANVFYESLSKGEYIFKLRARKPMSAWSDPLEFRIRIKATIWERPLFYIILSILTAGIIIIIILWRKNIEIKRREMEHQLVLLEQRALQSMMNPHFIFNSLGSIQNYLLQRKPGEAGLYLSQFARLIRQNLNASSTAMISLEEEVDRLKNYLDLEKIRMEQQCEYSIVVDDSLEPEEVFIPSMLIQPFVENAIWHGISNVDGPGRIFISFSRNDSKSIKIVVEDNGKGMKNEKMPSTGSGKHMAMGMALTRKRLDLLGQKYDVKTGITISEAFPGNNFPGTHIEMIIPFKEESTKKPGDGALPM